LPLPFSLQVAPDMGNAGYYALYVGDPGLFLPEVSYYGTARGQRLLGAFAEVGCRLLSLAGVANPETVVADAIAFDGMLLPYIRSAEADSAYVTLYNPVDLETFAGFGGAIEFERLASELLGVLPEQVIVLNPGYLEAFDGIVTEEHFTSLKHWMLLNTVFNLAGYLDQAFLHTAMDYHMALTGQAAPPDFEALAFWLATNIFGGVVGDYYGRTYFGEEARREVRAMAYQLIEAFKERLGQSDWLSPETIEAAIAKLDSLTVRIGYPDAVDPIYGRFTVRGIEDGGTLLSNTMDFARAVREENFARYGTLVDRDLWSITAHTVNAQYNAVANAITFPAAILQAPFYCRDQSASENYGGIGTVIAHEITHAFDRNGAQFGADGSLSNWWTAADHEAFVQKMDAMVALFDGRDLGVGAVNGALTVSENMADAGGLMCALEVAASLPGADLEAFFRNWATIWRMKSRPEYEALLLTLDVHAPGKLRANVQLSNLDAFYEVFELTAADGMYIPPSERVVIW
ncbi:MAG: M13 family metallopeptidase, partial [Oscillospiraceae bacterium]|nr:M13 family metallopeptidase [Oscillospiraceae bacterium]